MCGLLPFVVFTGTTSYQVTNGELTQYSCLNIGGITAAVLGFALLSRGSSAMSEHRRPGWAVPESHTVMIP